MVHSRRYWPLCLVVPGQRAISRLIGIIAVSLLLIHGIRACAGMDDITAVAVGDVYDMNDGKFNANPNGDTWVTSWGTNGEAWTSINDGTGWDSTGLWWQRGFGKLVGNPNEKTRQAFGE